MSAITRWCVPDGVWNTPADRRRILDDEIAAGWWSVDYTRKRLRLEQWRLGLLLDRRQGRKP